MSSIFFNKLKCYTIIFIFGASVYTLLELLWKGQTHFSMSIAGGLCFTYLSVLSTYFRNVSVFKLALIGSVFITFIELIFGFIFNVYLELALWDYSSEYLNFFGQICIRFSAYWFIISIPSLLIGKLIFKVLE